MAHSFDGFDAVSSRKGKARSASKAEVVPLPPKPKPEESSEPLVLDTPIEDIRAVKKIAPVREARVPRKSEKQPMTPDRFYNLFNGELTELTEAMLANNRNEKEKSIEKVYKRIGSPLLRKAMQEQIKKYRAVGRKLEESALSAKAMTEDFPTEVEKFQAQLAEAVKTRESYISTPVKTLQLNILNSISASAPIAFSKDAAASFAAQLKKLEAEVSRMDARSSNLVDIAGEVQQTALHAQIELQNASEAPLPSHMESAPRPLTRKNARSKMERKLLTDTKGREINLDDRSRFIKTAGEEIIRILKGAEEIQDEARAIEKMKNQIAIAADLFKQGADAARLPTRIVEHVQETLRKVEVGEAMLEDVQRTERAKGLFLNNKKNTKRERAAAVKYLSILANESSDPEEFKTLIPFIEQRFGKKKVVTREQFDAAIDRVILASKLTRGELRSLEKSMPVKKDEPPKHKSVPVPVKRLLPKTKR